MIGSRFRIAGAVGISIVAVATILLAPSRLPQCEGRPSDTGGFRQGPRLDQPFVEGRKVTVERARDDAGFPIRIPNHRLANMDSLSTVWHENFGPHFNHVAFEFSSGIQIILEPTPDGFEPYGYLGGVGELGPPAEIVFIHGVPASVYPANTTWDCKDTMSWTEEDAGVHVDLESVNYSITGPYPTEDLVAVARSLPAPFAEPLAFARSAGNQVGSPCVLLGCRPL